MEQRLHLSAVRKLVSAPHQNDDSYLKESLYLAMNDPLLHAHLVAWYHTNGNVRDYKTQAGVAGLRSNSDELVENSVWHLMQYDLRQIAKIREYNRKMNSLSYPVTPGAMKMLNHRVEEKIRYYESRPSVWDQVAVSHRDALRTIYATYHIKPSGRAKNILFEKNYPQDSVFQAIKILPHIDEEHAAALIRHHKIPFPIASSVTTPEQRKTNDVILALIDSLTRNQLINNISKIEEWVSDAPDYVKLAVKQRFERTKNDSRANVHKAEVALKHVRTDAIQKEVTSSVDESVLKNRFSMPVAILADKSSSMSTAIQVAIELAGTISAYGTNTYLVFFNQYAHKHDVTGKTLSEIRQELRHVSAGGMTSIGASLKLLRQLKIPVDKLVLISDGCENTYPRFSDELELYRKEVAYPELTYVNIRGIPIPGLRDDEYETIIYDANHHTIPTLMKMISTGGANVLIDEIMSTPLRRFERTAQ